MLPVSLNHEPDSKVSDTASLPLLTLLSFLLVAFTIEFDNEAELQRMGIKPRAWLVSLAFWSNFLALVPDEGISVAALEDVTGKSLNTVGAGKTGMERWGYVTVTPNMTSTGKRPLLAEWLVRPTPAGIRAKTILAPLLDTIESRWRDRFGSGAIDSLRSALGAIVSRTEHKLPRYLPVLGYGHTTEFRSMPGSPEPPDSLDLSALLSQVLLMFTLDFERDFPLSLAICANPLRVLEEVPVRERDLSGMTGVAKETLAVATGFLEKTGYAVFEPTEGATGQSIRLTEKGLEVKSAYKQRIAGIEENWRDRFGAAEIANLREASHCVIDERDGERSRLSIGLVPPIGTWRSKKPYLAQTQAFINDPVGSLPHFPMVSHRGGYPDGS